MMRTRHRAHGFWWLLVTVLLASMACTKKRDQHAQPSMASFQKLGQDAFGLVFLSNVEGYIEPCGCTQNPLGGLARFVTMYNDLKVISKNNLTLIDTGNLLFDTPQRNKADLCQDEARLDVLLKTLRSLGLKTSFIAGFDRARGEVFQQTLYQKHGLLSLPAQTIEVIEAPSFRLGVLAVGPDFSVPQRASIDKIIRESVAKHDLKAIILISHLTLEKTKLLFSDSTIIDVVIQANTASHDIKTPVRLSAQGPLLVEGGRQGQYFTAFIWHNLAKRAGSIVFDDRALTKMNREELLMSRIKVLEQQAKNLQGERLVFINQRMSLARDELSASQKIGSFTPLVEPNVSFHAIAITKKITPDAVSEKRIDTYEKNVPLLVKKCEEAIECPKAERGVASYVGAHTCKGCHQEAFAVWQKAVSFNKSLGDDGKEIARSVGHSKAWKTLADAGKDTDRSCIGCHSIGFMQPGGYCKAYEVDFRKDVQCESCHGAGSLHAQSGDKRLIKRAVPEETCRSCHHVPHIESYESFNYEERLMKVLGKGHGENLLKELTHKKKLPLP